MPNMSYCRFQNTASDFSDCVAHIRSLDPSDTSFNATEERRSRARMIRMAADLLEELGIEVGDYREVDEAIAELDADYCEDE